MSPTKFAMCLAAALTLSGCYIGPGGICGPQTPIIYCASKEEQDKLLHPKPYGAHWVKDGMTRESRREDIFSCGGGTDEHVGFPPSKIAKAKIPSDPNDINAIWRLRDQWAKCMTSKAYTYLERCDERCMYP